VVLIIMTTDTLIAAAAALVGALIALAIYHFAAVRPAFARLNALIGVHDDLIGGGAGAADRLSRLDGGVVQMGGLLERLAGRVSELEALAQVDISRVGFVRYNAYDDTGSEQSYALALLNRAGNGVVLTSLYSRADTRTFAKSVTGFSPTANASEEEIRAIELARTSTNA
jgi:hypothetical protein